MTRSWVRIPLAAPRSHRPSLRGRWLLLLTGFWSATNLQLCSGRSFVRVSVSGGNALAVVSGRRTSRGRPFKFSPHGGNFHLADAFMRRRSRRYAVRDPNPISSSKRRLAPRGRAVFLFLENRSKAEAKPKQSRSKVGAKLGTAAGQNGRAVSLYVQHQQTGLCKMTIYCKYCLMTAVIEIASRGMFLL